MSCGYPKPLALDRTPDGAVRGLVCFDCALVLADIDAGDTAPAGCYAEYLDNAWHLTH